MCAHYTIFIEQDELRDIVAAAEKNLKEATPNFKMATSDIWPKYFAPVLMPEKGEMKPAAMRWGFPLKMKKKRQKDPAHPEYTTKYVQNAKLETAQASRFWNDSLAERRCLIPVSGFFEWKTLQDKTKVPYYFYLPTSNLMYVAGMYKFFKTEDGEYLPHYTMMTTQPTHEVGLVHDRMPVVLTKAEEQVWLSGDFMALVNRSNIHLQGAETTKEKM